MWIAIIAGDDIDQLRANAAAAQVDIDGRRSQPEVADVTPATSISVGREKARPASARTPHCNKGCRTLQ